MGENVEGTKICKEVAVILRITLGCEHPLSNMTKRAAAYSVDKYLHSE
jgi:hypothetical protein